MVGVKSAGRLGNQMFQFAFIYSFAKKAHTGFYIDMFDKLGYFECSNKFYFQNSINKIRAQFLRICGKLDEIKISNLDPEFKRLINEKRDNTFFIGYFQSYICFSDSNHELKNLFQIKKKYQTGIALDSPYIGIHVRLGDYMELGNKNLGNDISLSKKYYADALNRLDTENYKLVVVSDNIEKAKELLPEQYSYKFYQDTEIIDFQTLLNAEKLVISNSTFSWWAAYLNNRSAEVIAPRFWMGTNTRTVYPPHIFENLNWTLIDN